MPPAGIRAWVWLRRRRRERRACRGARPAHPDHRSLGMIAELLRYPSDTASATERPDRRSDGLPDLSGAGSVTTLQPRREEGVGAKAAGPEIIHNRPHHVSPVRSYRPPPAIVIWRGRHPHPPGAQCDWLVAVPSSSKGTRWARVIRHPLPDLHPGSLAARASATSDDLPMPGSPPTQTTAPSPWRRASTPAQRVAGSCPRPTNPVTGQLVRVFTPERSVGFRRPRGLRFGPGGRLDCVGEDHVVAFDFRTESFAGLVVHLARLHGQALVLVPGWRTINLDGAGSPSVPEAAHDQPSQRTRRPGRRPAPRACRPRMAQFPALRSSDLV
jgi:hypothetical protein